MTREPGPIVRSERGARHEQEEVLSQACDGDVALDPAARVQQLRVGDAADLTCHAVVADRLKEFTRPRPRDLELCERRLVEQRGCLPARACLHSDSR